MNLGEFSKAVEDYDKAVAISTRLVEQEGRRELVNVLAGSLNNRGNALQYLGKLPEAVADHDKAIAIKGCE